jgi:hypothetical protein
LPEDKQNLKIIGRPDSKTQGKIVISMDRCVVDCSPREQIDKVLSNSNIAIYTLNYGIDLKNQSNPFKETLSGNFVAADSRFTKLLDMIMKVVKVDSDYGYFTKSHEVKSYTILDERSESISSGHDQVIFRAQIQMGSKTEEYERNYKKVFSVIAELGGYLKAMVILAFLYGPFLKRLYYIDVINTLYRIEKNEPLRNMHIDQQQEKKIRRSVMESGSIIFEDKDTEFKIALEIKHIKGDLDKQEVLKEPLNNTFDKSQLDSDQTSENDRKSPELKYGWMDWTSVIFPCLRTKKHKLLDQVCLLFTLGQKSRGE